MFGRRQDKIAYQLKLFDAARNPLAQVTADSFQLPEKTVVELSILYYDDPEPCHIHRAAVRKRALMELIEHCPAGQDVALVDLSPMQQRFFEADGATFLRIEEV